MAIQKKNLAGLPHGNVRPISAGKPVKPSGTAPVPSGAEATASTASTGSAASRLAKVTPISKVMASRIAFGK